MTKKRPVTIYKWEKPEGKKHHEKVKDGVGVFHEFGSDYDEFENGAASYSTAIVELSNGEVKNIPVDLIVFSD